MEDRSQPFIAKDGYEYADLAAYLLQEPTDCWRNNHLDRLRAQGCSPDRIKAWSTGYGSDTEGDKNDPSAQGRQQHRAYRAGRANGATTRFDF